MASGASRFGGPVYDATIHPAAANVETSQLDKLTQARNLHLFGNKTAAAEAYSHYHEPSPNPTAVAMMGLAQQAWEIHNASERVWEQPFPGVALGSGPSFSRAPSTDPVIGGVDHLRFNAHAIESKRASRARFGR